MGTQAAARCNKTERREAQKRETVRAVSLHPAEPQDTLDEAPDAYKRMEGILSAIQGTTDVAERLQPIYIIQSEEGVGIWKSHRLH